MTLPDVQLVDRWLA